MDTPMLRREDIAAALEAADVTVLVPPSAYYARRIEFSDPRTTCLAYDAETYGVFVAVIGALVGDVAEFANAARPVPFSHDNTVAWPHIMLAEATAEEWDDAHAEDERRAEGGDVDWSTYVPCDECETTGVNCLAHSISRTDRRSYLLAGTR